MSKKELDNLVKINRLKAEQAELHRQYATALHARLFRRHDGRESPLARP